MRFHILGIPHTATNLDYINCAYSQKVYKLCPMLLNLGHTVFHYGTEGSNPICTENVIVLSKELQSKIYTKDRRNNLFEYDINDICYKTFHQNTIQAIKDRADYGDFLLCMWGYGHKPVADVFEDKLIIVEPGIGYEDTFANYRVFESYTWMTHVYGLKQQKNGSWYDCVIPNYFDPNDFEYCENKEDWFLYLGRITQRKGVELAVQITKAIGAKLIITGSGKLCDQKECVNIKGDHIEFVGFADREKRKELLSKAKALFVPTYYIEPFAGVVIEAYFSGTPTITTDWGVFGENVLHGITGYRCRTFEQFCWAARNIENISSLDCRKWALNNFTMKRIANMYQEYFESLINLYNKGWYTKSQSRTNLDWLFREYP